MARRSGGRGWAMRWAAAAPVAVVALGASAAVVLGLLGPLKHDLDAFATLRPHFSVAALVAGLLLLALGSRRLAALSLGAGALGFALLGPVWSRLDAPPEGCRVAPLRVVAANVEGHDASDAEIAAMVAHLLALRPDVVATVETTPRFVDQAAPLLAALPHIATAAHRPSVYAGATVFSRLPLRRLGPRFKPEGAPTYAAVALDLGGREIGLLALHLSRPIIGPQDVEIAVAPELMADLPEPRVVLGDFNAAPWSYAASRVARAAGVRAAPGLRRTWRGVYPNPIGGPGLPAFVGAEIDVVMASPALGFTATGLADLPGSVHWAVWADLAWPLDADCAATFP